MTEYIKFRFKSEHGATAGLVLNADIYKTKSITDLSKCFPMREASKMHRLQCSEAFGTWDDAFNFDFDKE